MNWINGTYSLKLYKIQLYQWLHRDVTQLREYLRHSKSQPEHHELPDQSYSSLSFFLQIFYFVHGTVLSTPSLVSWRMDVKNRNQSRIHTYSHGMEISRHNTQAKIHFLSWLPRQTLRALNIYISCSYYCIDCKGPPSNLIS